MYVRFAKVAYRAKGLQIFQNRFAAFAPRDYVVNMKFNAGSKGRTCAAGTTGKAVTLKHMPAKAKRRASACCAAAGFSVRLNCG